jgi:hypothetical protein
MPFSVENLSQRIKNKIVIAPNGCWNWLAGKSDQGYGRLHLKGFSTRVAHRIIYELLKRRIPKNLTLDHLCRNRACVNPEHLEPVSLELNLLRGDGVGARNKAKTHCKYGHKFSLRNIYRWRGKRWCRQCGKRRQLAYKIQKSRLQEAA